MSQESGVLIIPRRGRPVTVRQARARITAGIVACVLILIAQVSLEFAVATAKDPVTAQLGIIVTIGAAISLAIGVYRLRRLNAAVASYRKVNPPS
jgi:hypothetical protein